MPRNTSGLKRGGPGRPKNVPNKVTQEAKAVALQMVSDPVYLQKLQADHRKRELNPAIEAMLWHYAYGKPKETVKVEGDLPAFRLVLDADAD